MFRREIEAYKSHQVDKWVEIGEQEFKRARELVSPEDFAGKFRLETGKGLAGSKFMRRELAQDNDADRDMELWLNLKQMQQLTKIASSLYTMKVILVIILVSMLASIILLSC